MRLNCLNLVQGGYTAPSLSEGFHGPQDLFTMVAGLRGFYRDANWPSWLAPISDAGLSFLIDLAYHASLVSEEGRFSHFRAMCRNEGSQSLLVSHFDPVRLNNVEAIRRLAPACTGSDSALLIEERDEQLYCDGVVSTGGVLHNIYPGYPNLVQPYGSPTLSVEVLGPGHIRVQEGMASSYEIKAGKVRQVSSYEVQTSNDSFVIDPVVQAVEDRILGQIAVRFSESQRPHQTQVRESLLLVLSRILRWMVDSHHGGALIFLPVDAQANNYDLDIKYPTHNLDLGDDLVSQWLAYAEVVGSADKVTYAEAVRNAELCRAKTLIDVEAVANFSAVDGCVILTNDLQVLGFGAKIGVSVNHSEQSRRLYKHMASNVAYETPVFMRAIGGTRHQSIARLCQVHNGVLAYAVSQDGELKLFRSDDNFAYAYGPLDVPSTNAKVSTR